MTQQSNGYKPNNFTIKNNIPVKWIIDSKDSRSCAASIVSSKIKVKKFLSSGENTIEFTPSEVGDIRFSCSMGMYTGKFIVIANDQPKDISNPKNSSSSNANNSPAETTASPKKDDDVQIIKANFIPTDANSTTDIKPNEFTVTAGKPVRFEVYAEIEGEGCMSTITIPNAVSSPQFLEKGKTIIFEFTPKKGDYLITCAMGAIRGKIKAI